ncbi:MAG: hydrogenase maturation protease [Kiritimatiellaeota bacterium]|nr:hydrogenase maturation protease [Kiritimatiellota bacterium]
MPPSVLIFGYGNPGRQDDGLGIACVEALEQWAEAEHIPQLVFDTNYQLNAEDALTVSGHDLVIFADATRDSRDPFSFRRLVPQPGLSFSTHALSPEAVLALCAELYDQHPPAYLLAIQGRAWEPNGAMTPAAQSNLAAALAFIKPILRDPDHRGLDAKSSAEANPPLS